MCHKAPCATTKELWRLRAPTTEPTRHNRSLRTLEHALLNKRSHHNEKLLHFNQRVAPTCHN